MDRLLVETDAPWLAPTAFRGKRNEPIYVEEVAKHVASVRGMSLEEIRKTDDGECDEVVSSRLKAKRSDVASDRSIRDIGAGCSGDGFFPPCRYTRAHASARAASRSLELEMTGRGKPETLTSSRMGSVSILRVNRVRLASRMMSTMRSRCARKCCTPSSAVRALSSLARLPGSSRNSRTIRCNSPCHPRP